MIQILLLSDKTEMSLSHEDQTLWPIYITIGNLNSKTWQIQTHLATLLLRFIPIVYEFSKDKKNKERDLKAKIYHLALTIIL